MLLASSASLGTAPAVLEIGMVLLLEHRAVLCAAPTQVNITNLASGLPAHATTPG